MSGEPSLDDMPDPQLVAGLTHASAVGASMSQLIKERAIIMQSNTLVADTLATSIASVADYVQTIQTAGTALMAMMTALQGIGTVDNLTATKAEMDAHIVALNDTLDGFEPLIREYVIAQDSLMVASGAVAPSSTSELNESISALHAVLGQLQLDTQLEGIPATVPEDPVEDPEA